MKKIVLIDASPRKGGNSEAVTDIIANDLAGCEVTVFKIHEKDCRPCVPAAPVRERTRSSACRKTI